MSYSVLWAAQAVKQLKKLDKSVAALILRWVNKNLEGCSDPCAHGKALTADRAGQWRYRVGDYRLIAEIKKQEVVILILTVGHRKEVYDKK